MKLASLEYAKPLQEEEELKKLIALLKKENVRSYLEVGVRYGGSFERIMRSLPVGSFGMAVDLPGGPFGDEKSENILLAVAARLRQEGYEIEVVFGSSKSPLIRARAQRRGPFDAVLLDADHAYEAIKNDFQNFASIAKLIVIHDIAAPEGLRSHDGRPVEVPRFWQEIREGFRHTEFVKKNSQMGIGVIWREEQIEKSA